jgi:hypothetical protein
MPSSRAGKASWLRKAGNEIREASAKRISVSVASTNSFRDSPPMCRSIKPSTGPTSRPAAVKNIAGVTTDRSSRRETAENASNASAIAASSQSPSSYLLLSQNGH